MLAARCRAGMVLALLRWQPLQALGRSRHNGYGGHSGHSGYGPFGFGPPRYHSPPPANPAKLYSLPRGL